MPIALLRALRRPSIGSALLALAACTPALNWREVRPAATPLQLLMPCKATAQERQVMLAGQSVALTLHACAAAGQTWGLASAALQDPARVQAALQELGAAAASNIAATEQRSHPMQVTGATPHALSQRRWLQGTLPDGKPVAMQVLVFVHGLRVFQATVLGAEPDKDSADAFFASLRIQP